MFIPAMVKGRPLRDIVEAKAFVNGLKVSGITEPVLGKSVFEVMSCSYYCT